MRPVFLIKFSILMSCFYFVYINNGKSRYRLDCVCTIRLGRGEFEKLHEKIQENQLRGKAKGHKIDKRRGGFL